MSELTDQATVEVPLALAGERIDRAVALLTGRTRSEVAALVTAGAVRLGGERVFTRHRRVLAGQLLELPPREEHVEPEGLTPARPGTVPFQVLYEDADVIVVDKPAGVVVHPGAGHREGTLAAGLLGAFPDLAEAGAAGSGDPSRPGIVHRLDKDTSGLLVVARHGEAYRSLVAQLGARTVSRSYRALVLGSVLAGEGLVDAPIGRSPRDPTKMAVSTGGKQARTRYLVEARYRDPLEATLLEVNLETGRTHQIRVHLAAIGHPVAGDTRYGGSHRALQLRRPFLHAERLVFVHPRTGVPVEVSSPLPPELVEVLDRFA